MRNDQLPQETLLKPWHEALADRVQQLADAGCDTLTILQVMGLIAFVRDGEGHSPAESADPVAWQCKWSEATGWLIVHTKDVERIKATGIEIRPLYVHPHVNYQPANPTEDELADFLFASDWRIHHGNAQSIARALLSKFNITRKA